MNSAPLRDMSGGLMKGWPGGGVHLPGGEYVPTFRPAGPDEKPVATVHRGPVPSVYCKYCDQDVRPLVLRELVFSSPSVMTICSECGAGLSRPVAEQH